MCSYPMLVKPSTCARSASVKVNAISSGMFHPSDDCSGEPDQQQEQTRECEMVNERGKVTLWRKNVCNILDSWQYQTVTIALVLTSLFSYNLAIVFDASRNFNPYIDSILIVAMAFLYLDIILNIVCQVSQNWVLVFMDFISTSTILVDLSWVIHAAGLYQGDANTFSQARAFSAQSVRMLRLIRPLLALKIVSYFMHVARRVLTKHKPEGTSNIGVKLTEALIVQIALFVVVIVVTTAFLISWRNLPETINACVALLHSFALENDTRKELEVPVQTLKNFVDNEIKGLKLLSIIIGEEKWNWVEDNSSAAFTQLFSIDQLDIYKQTSVQIEIGTKGAAQHDALIDIIVVSFLLVVFLVLIVVVNLTVYKIMVYPFERIYQMINKSAGPVIAATTGIESPSSLELLGDHDDNIGAIEAAIAKMSRIIVHTISTGPQGSYLMNQIAANADISTKEWLATMLGNGMHPSNSSAQNSRGHSQILVRPDLNSRSTSGASKTLLVDFGTNGSIEESNCLSACSHATLSSSKQAAVSNSEMNNRFHKIELSCDARSSLSVSTSTIEDSGAPSCPAISISSCEMQVLGDNFFFGLGLSEKQQEQLLCINIDELNTFEFDVLKLEQDALVPSIVCMFLHLNLARFGPTPELSPYAIGQVSSYIKVPTLWRFIEEVSKYYKQVPYHNFYHCADVVHATFLLLSRIRLTAGITPLECFALMIAAVAHDMDHPGVNNAFLVNSRDKLALTYNDSSVLENRHVACLYALVQKNPEIDIFQELQPDQWKEARRIIITTVLHTDMTQHFALISKLDVFLELHSTEIKSIHAAQNDASTDINSSSHCHPLPGNSEQLHDISYLFETSEDKTLLLCTILHCADISNPSRAPETAENWTNKILAEFFLQGDKERASGQVISPLCDRETTSQQWSQINFIEYVVSPIFEQLSRIFPETGELLINATTTLQFWKASLKQELLNRGQTSEISTIEMRLASYMEKYKNTIALSRKRKIVLQKRQHAACVQQKITAENNRTTHRKVDHQELEHELDKIDNAV